MRLLTRFRAYLKLCMAFINYDYAAVRPAIDAGNAGALFGSFFAVLLIGSLARMVADVVVAIAWQVWVSV